MLEKSRYKLIFIPIFLLYIRFVKLDYLFLSLIMGDDVLFDNV